MRVATRLEEWLKNRTGRKLRSIIRYEGGEFEVTYLRDDVAQQSTEDEIKAAVDESRMESLTAPIYNNAFSEAHGDLTCLVKIFENVVELNFVVADGLGTAVALDVEALENTHDLIAEAREIVLDEQE
jgi:hypothetical protein